MTADYDAEFTDALLFGTKTFRVCGQARPQCRTYWKRDTRMLDGLANTCKTCLNAVARAKYADDPVAYARARERQAANYRRHRDAHLEEVRAHDRERKAREYAAREEEAS